jgi:HSP20 family molecular chaperone IbpA
MQGDSKIDASALSSVRLKSNKSKAKKKTTNNNVIIPNFYQKIEYNHNNNEKQVVIVVELPLLNSASEAKLDVASRMFKLKATAKNNNTTTTTTTTTDDHHGGEESTTQYLLSTELNENVDPDRVTASFSKKKRVLTITIPLASK